MSRTTVRGAVVQRRWPWYLLVASLAGNMLLGGVLLAQTFFHHPPPRGLERGAAHFVERASKVLSPADAELVRRAFEEERPSLARMHDNMEAMGKTLRDSVRTNPFDAEALSRAFEQTQATELEMRRRIDAKVVETLSRMSEDGRRRLLELGGNGRSP